MDSLDEEGLALALLMTPEETLKWKESFGYHNTLKWALN